jgi:hypothetical protein
MVDKKHDWPLKNPLPDGHQHFTKSELIEILNEVDGDDEPVWIDNYWQPVRQITQRPIDVIGHSEDGWHIG